MKKHFKKKFRIEFTMDQQEEEELKKAFNVVSWSDSPNVKTQKGQPALLITDSGNMILSFP